VLLESIQAIKSETASMTDLIESLLFLARGDRSTIILDKEKIRLNELVGEVIKESRLIAPEHYLTYDADNLIELAADKKMIKQMLRVLIDNSIKFTPKGGEIGISVENEHGIVKLVVKDTGIGIPQDEIEKIFNRFYRTDKVRSKETGGSGLGLSIAKLIVDAHNGEIYAVSETGKGTSIIVTLPQYSN
jgi:signal transduction histidine kinase